MFFNAHRPKEQHYHDVIYFVPLSTNPNKEYEYEATIVILKEIV